MDDGDEYIPQISQMEYMMDTNGPGSMSNGSQQYNCSGGMSGMNYYDTNDSNALNAMQQMTNMYVPQQQGVGPGPGVGPGQPYMTPQQQQMMYQQQQQILSQMRPPVPPQPVKQKRQRKSKKAEAAEAAAAQQQQQQQQRYGSGYMQHPSMMPMRPPTNPYDYNQQQNWPPTNQYPTQTPQNYRPNIPTQPQQTTTGGQTPNGYGQTTSYPSTNQPQPPPNPYYQQQIRPPYYPQQSIPPTPSQGYPSNPQQQPRYPTTPTPTQTSQQTNPQSTTYGGYMDMNGYGYPQQPTSSTNYPKNNSQPPSQQQQPQQQPVVPNGTMTNPSYNQPTNYPNQIRPPYMQQPPTHMTGPNGQQPPPPPPFYHPQQIQMELMDCDRNLQILYQQPKTPDVLQKIEFFNQKMMYFRKVASQIPPPQQIPTGYPQTSMISPQHYPPPMSQDMIKPPLSQPTSEHGGNSGIISNNQQQQLSMNNLTPDIPGSIASTSSTYSKDGIIQETNHVPPPQQYGNYQKTNYIQQQQQQPEIFDPQQIKNVDQMLAGTSELITAEENYPEEHKIERIENINVTKNHENNIVNDFQQISQGVQQVIQQPIQQVVQQQEISQNVDYDEKKDEIEIKKEEENGIENEKDDVGQEESNQSLDDYDYKPPHAPAPRDISEEDDDSRNYQFQHEEEEKLETNNLEEKIDENSKNEEKNDIVEEEGPLSPPPTPQQINNVVENVEDVIETKNDEIDEVKIKEPSQESTTCITNPILMEPRSESSSMDNTPNIPSEATYETTPIPENYVEEDSMVVDDQPSVSVSQDGNDEYLPNDIGKKKINRLPPKPRIRKPPAPKKTTNKNRKRKKESDFEDDEDEDFAISAKSARKQKKIAQAIAAAAAEITEAEQAAGFQASDLIEKRRSVRKRIEDKSYADESLMEFEVPLQENIENNGDDVEEEKPWTKYQNVWLVEKILAMRKEERPVKVIEEEKTGEKDGNDEKIEEKMDVEDDGKDESTKMELVDTFLVKYKHKSYRHCKWKTIEELTEYDPKVIPRCNRFRQKNEYLDEDADEVFNDDFCIPSRIIDIEKDDDGNDYCYIKWCALSYDEATWENGNDKSFDDLKISYHLWNDEIDPVKVKIPSRPGPEYFKPVTVDKEYKGENQLREYQVEGVNWLLYCYFERNNCILADEMGLGKTVQTITLLQGIYDTGVHGPFLVVVPLSTLHNWEREFQTWTDMNAIVYHGQSKSREIIQNNEFYYKQSKKKIPKFDVIITTFEMVVTDCEVLKRFNYRVCVIDEAHRLKNKNCKLLTSGLSNFKVDHRVLLTGTPLQNNITELYSLLNFLDPTKFGSQDEFLEQFGNCQTEEQVNALQGMLKPMMLRRLKEDVEKTLQPKEETIIEVQLSNIQKKYYRAILERNFTHLLKSSHMPSMMNTMMELRKCCNHPYLIKGAEDQILQEVRDMYPEQNQHEQVTTALIQASGKLVLIDKLLPKLRQDGHKVLIFSQMVKVLDILEEFLGIKNFTYERIDGNVRGDLRQAAIDRFSKPDSDKFVFLLCTRAGGLGINLTAADTVIIFDSDWNPQNDLQAQARCHRIGQTKMVKVYRLITSNTYEREMFDRASLKLGLDKAVLQSMAPKEQNAPLTKKEVEDLLKKGAYGAVMDEDNEGSKFSEEDIETILQRRTTTITIEPGIKGSKFAKASFKSTTNEDIDVDDPNFWQKWANKAKIEIKEKNSELILEEPRSRRKRFDEYNQQNDNSNDDENSDDENNKKLRDRTTNDLRNRSGKKRRRGDDDDDEYYGTAAPPDELIFNKSEYFKLEKFILQFGWGRWDAIELCFEGEKNSKEVEHMTRTLLLHCLREFRGDERTRDYVWNLIIPSTTKDEKHVTTSKRTSTMFTDGWASKPEYNPPGFALDTAFHRHIYRHTNKLVTRVHHLHILEHNIITEKWIEKCKDPTISYQEIEFTIPTVNDPVIQGWDKDHDKCLIIGIYRHGAENYELINKDEKLLFHDKSPELLPTPMELNNRFKRIIQLELRKTETATQNSIQLKVQIQNQVATRGIWTEKEEKDFLKTLINFGVWDYSSGDKINIKWHKFRDYTPSLTRKTDGQMIENLYCILARCSLSMGTNLSDIDEYRAKQTRELPKKMCTIVMQRLTLMRKIHINFMTKDDDVRKIHIRMMPLDKMPNGWTHEHDEKMFQIADGCGISWFKIKLSKLPEFQNIKLPSEQVLFRRLFEIVATVDAGKYVGEHEQMVFEFEDDEPTEEDMLMFIVTAMFADKDKNGQAQTALQLALAAATVTQQQQPSTSSTPSTSSDLIGTSRRSQAKKKNIPTSTSTNKKEQQQKSSSLMSQADQLALQNYMALLAATTQGNKANEALQLQQQLAALMQLSQLSSTSVMAQNNALTVKALEDALNLSKKEPSKISEFEKMIAQQLGVSLPDVQLIQALDANMKISMYDPETKNKITGDKAPSITQLESWMKLNPKYRVDPSQPFMTTTQKKLVNSLLGTSSSSMGSTSSTSNSNKVNGNMNDNPGSSSSTPSTSTSEHGTLEPGEIPKPSTSKSTDYDNVSIGLWSRSTGQPLAKERWPTLRGLQNFLDKNPDYNVLSSYSTIVKNTLSKTYQNRIGGEEAVQALQAAMLLNPATAAYLLSAAGTVNPTTSAANNANANSTTALTPQQQQQQAAMDAIQMQIALSMYGPYAAMGLTGLGTGLTAGSGLTGANLNQFGSTSSTTPSTTKSSTKTTTTTNSSNKNANSASSSSTTTTTTSATTSSNNVASQLLQESALTAELMSNPAFTQLLLQNTLPPTTAATNNPLAGYNMTEANFIQQLNALNTLQFLANQQAAAAAAANNQSTNPSTSQSTNPSTSQSTNQSTNTNSTPKPSSSSSSEKKSSTNTSTPSSSNSKKSLGKIVEDLTKGSS